MVYEHLVRPILFRMWNRDPETAHEKMMHLLTRVGRSASLRGVVSRMYPGDHTGLKRKLFGLTFRNAVGLAGGFDKNAVAIGGFEALGFGFIEIGTITRHAQPGNPKPRVFRLPNDEAIINRFGFNNDGADAVAARLATTPRNPAVPLGISIGKSKVTPLEAVVEDYLYSFRTLHAHADYFAINVSSPNTPGLRQLQDRDGLRQLLAALDAERRRLGHKPILVKISPDLEPAALDELLQVCADHHVDGLIATNTTLSREGLCSADPARKDEAGGLSGAPLRERALGVVRHVRIAMPAIPIIGVGGIMSADDALRMLDAGADLLQIYTGLVYHGPGLVGKINKAMVSRGLRTS